LSHCHIHRHKNEIFEDSYEGKLQPVIFGTLRLKNDTTIEDNWYQYSLAAEHNGKISCVFNLYRLRKSLENYASQDIQSWNPVGREGRNNDKNNDFLIILIDSFNAFDRSLNISNTNANIKLFWNCSGTTCGVYTLRSYSQAINLPFF